MGKFIWDSIPSYIRVPVVIGLIFLWTPIKIREVAIEFVHKEALAAIGPMKTERDKEILTMKNDIRNTANDTADTKAYVRAIGIHLMGSARIESIDNKRQQANP